ncbi:MAG: beta-glucosidase [Solirubrobacteraceae bacterium]
MDDRELTARVERLTTEQKIRLLTGADSWSLHEEPDVGLRRLVVSDGPAGVRGEHWDERDTSTDIPSPTALAATWDELLVQEVGRLLACEARRKRVDVLLAPTVNLHRTPYAGRHFECFSEDPLLTARIAVAYVRGVQGGGVGATVKHFVANDSETERMTLDAKIDERTLFELHLAPFEAVVREANVWAVMAAYNSVNGHSMTESPLLEGILKRRWGFDGVVMSDWFATRSTEDPARAALDLAMPGPDGPWGDALAEAVRAGTVDEAAIDDKVLRILRLAGRVGALEGGRRRPAPRYGADELAWVVRRVAAAGFVLARNQRGVLPLDRLRLRRVAVIGPNAATARTLGGGSATVFAPYTVSPLQGLLTALPATVEVRHCIGVTLSSRIPVAGSPWVFAPDGDGPGVQARLLAADGTELLSERRPGCAFHWPDHVGAERVAKAEVSALIRATGPGTYTIAISGTGRYRLMIGDEEVLDDVLEPRPGADVVETLVVPPRAAHRVELDRGEQVRVEIVNEIGSTPLLGIRFSLNVGAPHGSDDDEIDRAVSLARSSDVAVVVVGTTEEIESEGFDRASLALPGRQDELVERVAHVNPDTIVVVNSGAPVLLPWADSVAAVLLTWFAGQEFGNALADVLLGDAEPGGRLPTSWPLHEEGLASTQPADGVLRYDEGLLVGYRGYERGGPAPLYPFGHGLGYSSWTYLSIDAPRKAAAGAAIAVDVTVRNSGARRAREVVQLYASRAVTAVERPARWLIGFAAVDANAGEDVTATITVRERAFQHWSPVIGGWTTELGAFQLAAGASSTALSLFSAIEIFRGETSAEGHGCPPPDLSSARRTPGLPQTA